MAEFVLTLIATPPSPSLIPATVDRAADALERLGARVASSDWLAPDIACDLFFDDLNPDQASVAARDALDDSLKVDLVVQPVAGRRKRLLVADMEATIIENEMLEELADLLGLRLPVAEITRRAMNGEIDFADALRERVALLKDLPESALDEAGAQIRISAGAHALVHTMEAHGAHTMLVSGGFRFYTSRIRAALGFHGDSANELIVRDGRLAGTVREPILAREAKLEALRHAAGELQIPLALTLAVGDGANDLPMLQAAGLGIAYHAKPAVRAQARARIDHADLTALLYAQGYRAEEIVA